MLYGYYLDQSFCVMQWFSQSSSKSTVLSYWMVGVTLWINLRNTNSENSTLGLPPLLMITSIMFFIAFAWLQG